MGKFHQLRVRQKTIFKILSIKGYQNWLGNADTLAFGSVGASFKGHHCVRNMRINKEIFSALVQFRAENITNDYQDLAHEQRELKSLISKITKCLISIN